MTVAASVRYMTLLLRPGDALKIFGLFILWFAPWIACGYFVRSATMRLEASWARSGVYWGSLLSLGLITMICSWHWGVMDGEVQALLAASGALPMTSTTAGGFADLIARQRKVAGKENAGTNVPNTPR